MVSVDGRQSGSLFADKKPQNDADPETPDKHNNNSNMSTSNSPLLGKKDFDGTWLSDRRLLQLNIGAGILHLVQGVMMLIASQVVDSIKDFKKEITTSFLKYDPIERKLLPDTKGTDFYVEVGLMAAVFLLMSAVAHLWVIVTFKKFYIPDLDERERNRARWYEYALSSSVMIVAIAVLFGCYDLGSLILIFACNASMNFFGLLMENANGPDRESTDWSAYNFGWLAGIAPWIVIFMYFFGSGNFDEIPGFVYGILFSYIFFFMSFAFNMFLQYKKVWKWSEYRFGELCYVILSLVSKSLLAWLVFGGTFQPN